MESHKPYIAMLFTQLVYAGMALFSKAAIAKGMNPYVFVVYRQAFASLALAPFAFFLERLFKNSSYFHISVSPLFFLPIYKSYWFFFFSTFDECMSSNILQKQGCSLIILLTLQNLLGFTLWVCNISNFYFQTIKNIFLTRLCMYKFLGSHSV